MLGDGSLDPGVCDGAGRRVAGLLCMDFSPPSSLGADTDFDGRDFLKVGEASWLARSELPMLDKDEVAEAVFEPTAAGSFQASTWSSSGGVAAGAGDCPFPGLSVLAGARGALAVRANAASWLRSS